MITIISLTYRIQIRLHYDQVNHLAHILYRQIFKQPWEGDISRPQKSNSFLVKRKRELTKHNLIEKIKKQTWHMSASSMLGVLHRYIYMPNWYKFLETEVLYSSALQCIFCNVLFWHIMGWYIMSFRKWILPNVDIQCRKYEIMFLFIINNHWFINKFYV